ncbi:unnamed protein product [Cunninghamella blakesleeana]
MYLFIFFFYYYLLLFLNRIQNHAAINGGTNDNWPNGNAPGSMGYLTRSQIPYQFALSDAFTTCDAYHQSVIGSTNPNRVHWMSGSIQGPPNDYILQDNTETISLGWETYPEVLTKANVTWQVFQDKDNFDDNPLAWFKYWRNIADGPEKQKGLGVLGLDTFYTQARNGTLPQVSIIVGPTELSEHPNNTPQAGAWLQEQVVNAVMNSPAWKETALFINYDESGGFYDHVIPPLAPADKYVKDKFNGKMVPIGLGPRVPMIIVSPFTRGGNVFTDVADHSSSLMFLEEWIGKYDNGSFVAPASNIDEWYRKTSSNLVDAFDFDKPDYTIPKLPINPKPAQTPSGVWDPTEMCEKLSDPKTKPPYGNQVVPVVEKGSKIIRGANIIGHTLSFVGAKGRILDVTHNGKKIGSSKLKKRGVNDSTKTTRFVVVPSGNGKQYMIQSVSHPDQCLDVWGNQLLIGECKGTLFTFDFHGSDAHHHIQHVGTGKYVNISGNSLKLVDNHHDAHFTIYSVTD